MPKRPANALYSLIEIPVFDARTGLSRCSIKGIGASVDGYAAPIAEFWRGADGSILVRVKLKEARHAFEARLLTGEPISEAALEAFSWFVSEQLLRWTTAIDEEPFDEVAFPSVIVPPTDATWLARLLLAWMEYENSNRYPEIVLELISEVTNRRDIQKVADEDNYGIRYSLLFDAIQKTRKKLESSAGFVARQTIKKEVAASAVKRLVELEQQLVIYSLFDPPQRKQLKSVEDPDKSYRWENDPFLGPNDAARWRRSNFNTVNSYYRQGVSLGDESFARATALDREGYALWLKTK